MKYQEFALSANEALHFDEHVLVVLTQGNGVFQVDFRNYDYGSGKGFFLSPGQYLRMLSGSLKIRTYTFTGSLVQQYRDARFLFKHLISLGHIDLSSPKRFHLSEVQMIQINGSDQELLHASIRNWLAMNPFRASRGELDLLFDLKELVDNNYEKPLAIEEVAGRLGEKVNRIKHITRQKLASTVYKIKSQKRLLEAKRSLAFTQQSTKEISYQLGFNHTTHFNKFFKLHTDTSPGEFRERMDFNSRDTLVDEFEELLQNHFNRQRFLAFYADRLFVSEKTLARKIKASYGVGFHELLKNQILNHAEALLSAAEPVTEVAYALGFKEPNHFSSFFKRYKGQTPTAYLASQMYTP